MQDKYTCIFIFPTNIKHKKAPFTGGIYCHHLGSVTANPAQREAQNGGCFPLWQTPVGLTGSCRTQKQHPDLRVVFPAATYLRLILLQVVEQKS